MTEEERDVKLAGLVSAVFFLIGGPASLIAGYVDPIVNRIWALWVIVLVGEGPLLLTVWVSRFSELFVLRYAASKRTVRSQD